MFAVVADLGKLTQCILTAPMELSAAVAFAERYREQHPDATLDIRLVTGTSATRPVFMPAAGAGAGSVGALENNAH